MDAARQKLLFLLRAEKIAFSNRPLMLSWSFMTQTAYTRRPGASGLSRTSLSGNC